MRPKLGRFPGFTDNAKAFPEGEGRCSFAITVEMPSS